MERLPDRKELRIFVASPGDVDLERTAVESAAQDVAKREGCSIAVHRFESAPPTVSGGPAAEVERHHAPLADFDVVVVIVWTRYGTMIPGEDRSGTDREFQKALAAQEHSPKGMKRPEILFYQCITPVAPNGIDPDQIRRLTAFVDGVSRLGIVKKYGDRDKFGALFSADLVTLLREFQEQKQRVGAARPRLPETITPDEMRREIEHAKARIGGHIYRTPLVRNKRLERDLHCVRVFLKLECIQVTGSFKVRGAMNAVLLHPEVDTFATASAGNHGLGLAYSASNNSRKSHVYVPTRTPLTKRRAIERWTPNVELYGDTFEETKAYAIQQAAASGHRFVHPYDDPEVIAGQGTIALEMLEDFEALKEAPPDEVIVPAGGGGLLAGIATVLKLRWPNTRLVAAQSSAFPSLSGLVGAREAPREVRREPARGGREGPVRTFADGIAVAEAGKLPMRLLRRVVDEVVEVSEESIAMAVIRLAEDLRVIAEGAGACALGALLARATRAPSSLSGRRILVVVSGGNLDTLVLSKLIERGLVLAYRVAHFRFGAEDVPGALARITRDLADLQVNILDLWQDRRSSDVPVGGTDVHVIVETRDNDHIVDILVGLKDRGHRVERIMV